MIPVVQIAQKTRKYLYIIWVEILTQLVVYSNCENRLI